MRTILVIVLLFSINSIASERTMECTYEQIKKENGVDRQFFTLIFKDGFASHKLILKKSTHGFAEGTTLDLTFGDEGSGYHYFVQAMFRGTLINGTSGQMAGPFWRAKGPMPSWIELNSTGAGIDGAQDAFNIFCHNV